MSPERAQPSQHHISRVLQHSPSLPLLHTADTSVSLTSHLKLFRVEPTLQLPSKAPSQLSLGPPNGSISATVDLLDSCFFGAGLQVLVIAADAGRLDLNASGQSTPATEASRKPLSLTEAVFLPERGQWDRSITRLPASTSR
ncbi:hypothetical protein CRENBAI_004115 [Crenichthys baileyi]|uniref:Uncharacterized protein n=1 Tax=Crenichthys baileyi TaxID=28760 RepID=A0AAV9RBW7_9TELE